MPASIVLSRAANSLGLRAELVTASSIVTFPPSPWRRRRTVGVLRRTLDWMSESRTTNFEEIAARFCGMPLAAETVFLGAAYRRGWVEREVCDVLFALRQQGIVVSLKSQEDSGVRTGDELRRWWWRRGRRGR